MSNEPGYPPADQPPPSPPGEPLASQPSPVYPAGQPVYPPAYQVAPPAKSKFPWKIVLIVLGVLAVLCCIGSLIGGFFIYRAVQDATGPARNAVTGYFDDLKAGNFGSAYSRLCDETQQEVTRDDFVTVQQELPKVTDYKVVGVNINTTNGKTTGTVNVRVTRETGAVTTQSVELVKEGNSWKVCEPGP